eukprot:673390-Prorocentrum_minimum.AAC.1
MEDASRPPVGDPSVAFWAVALAAQRCRQVDLYGFASEAPPGPIPAGARSASTPRNTYWQVRKQNEIK